jgi:hypothetical protein
MNTRSQDYEDDDDDEGGRLRMNTRSGIKQKITSQTVSTKAQAQKNT